MIMTATIWLIMFSLLILFVGYTIWRFDYNDKNSVLKFSNDCLRADYAALKDWCDVLTKDNKKFMKYVPITELKKDLILSLHNKGLTGKEIGKIVWLKKTTINAALRKWKKEFKK